MERKTLRLAWAGLCVAAFTGLVFFQQFREMRKQTDILSKQAEQAAKDSVETGKRVEKQLTIAQQQVDASRDAVYAELRPWIGPINWVMEGDVTPQRKFTITVHIENFGRTPAFVSRYMVAYWLRKPPFPNNPDFIGGGHPIPSHQVMYPGETARSMPMENFVGRGQLTDILSEQKRMYVYGEVVYTDTLRPTVTHHTHFCAFYDPGTKAFTGCPNYREAD